MCRAPEVEEMLSEVVQGEDTTGRMRARAAAAGLPATEDLEAATGVAAVLALAAAEADAVAGGGADEHRNLPEQKSYREATS
jgi:hypothetical protein